MTKRIGIIGSGAVGQTLANGFIKHGYEVMIGTNSPGKRDELRAKTHGKAKIGSFEETARFGEIVVTNRGGLIRTFTEEVAALEWLLGKARGS